MLRTAPLYNSRSIVSQHRQLGLDASLDQLLDCKVLGNTVAEPKPGHPSGNKERLQVKQLTATLLVPCVKSSTGWARRKLMAKELAKAFDVPAWPVQNLKFQVICLGETNHFVQGAWLHCFHHPWSIRKFWGSKARPLGSHPRCTSEMHIRLQLLVFWIQCNPRAHWRQCNRSKPKFLSSCPKLPPNVVPKKQPRRTLPQFQSSFGIKRWDSIEVAQANRRTSRKSRFEKPYCSSETVCTPDGARKLLWASGNTLSKKNVFAERQGRLSIHGFTRQAWRPLNTL